MAAVSGDGRRPRVAPARAARVDPPGAAGADETKKNKGKRRRRGAPDAESALPAPRDGLRRSAWTALTPLTFPPSTSPIAPRARVMAPTPCVRLRGGARRVTS